MTDLIAEDGQLSWPAKQLLDRGWDGQGWKPSHLYAIEYGIIASAPLAAAGARVGDMVPTEELCAYHLEELRRETLEELARLMEQENGGAIVP